MVRTRRRSVPALSLLCLASAGCLTAACSASSPGANPGAATPDAAAGRDARGVLHDAARGSRDDAARSADGHFAPPAVDASRRADAGEESDGGAGQDAGSHDSAAADSTPSGDGGSADGEAAADGACEWGGAPGTCISLADCAAMSAHTSFPDECPGPANIQCCIVTPNTANNPPTPAGYMLMQQSQVTSQMTAWAVMILNDPTTYPMFSTTTMQFGTLDVLARVEWHPPDFQNSVVHRGVTLYVPV